MKTNREVLEDAISLIDNPDHWIQRTYAQDVEGNPTFALGPTAHSWCAVGALQRAIGENMSFGRQQLHDITMALTGERDVIRLTGYNDNHLHSEVILFLKQGLDKLPE